ncbi:hypothetical protein J6590_029687 [Homalodisca vitripennis]|nr:hypothetical protein J6590_029687 [Homalodisca vitripennis]
MRSDSRINLSRDTLEGGSSTSVSASRQREQAPGLPYALTRTATTPKLLYPILYSTSAESHSKTPYNEESHNEEYHRSEYLSNVPSCRTFLFVPEEIWLFCFSIDPCPKEVKFDTPSSLLYPQQTTSPGNTFDQNALQTDDRHTYRGLGLFTPIQLSQVTAVNGKATNIKYEQDLG